MAHIVTSVLENRPVAQDYYELRLAWPSWAPAPQPGQFLTVRTVDGPVPLLRRPFAFSGFDRADSSASIIYQRRGHATTLMTAKRPFDPFDILAPLGNGFPDPTSGRRPILIAGGIGMGPMLFLAERLAQSPSPGLLIIGARSAQYLPRVVLSRSVQTILCTDDGSAGRKGSAIEVAREEVRQEGCAPELYLCGPHGMLAAGHALAEELDALAWVAMEQTMGCAVGACMGCVVRVHGGEEYARVCMEGPVFDSRTVVWT